MMMIGVADTMDTEAVVIGRLMPMIAARVSIGMVHCSWLMVMVRSMGWIFADTDKETFGGKHLQIPTRESYGTFQILISKIMAGRVEMAGN